MQSMVVCREASVRKTSKALMGSLCRRIFEEAGHLFFLMGKVS